MKTERIPVWYLSLVTVRGALEVIPTHSYEFAAKMAVAYGEEMLPEVSGPFYHKVPAEWREGS